MADHAQRTIADLVFVGFNKRVAALDRYTGEKIWDWKAPQGSGYAAVLVDGDRLIVSVSGYMYCLDPIFGQQVWMNPLDGMGTGTPCIASLRGHTGLHSGAAATIAQQQQAAAAAAAG